MSLHHIKALTARICRQAIVAAISVTSEPAIPTVHLAGQYAYVGLGFNQRSDAFDFNVALQDALKCVQLPMMRLHHLCHFERGASPRCMRVMPFALPHSLFRLPICPSALVPGPSSRRCRDVDESKAASLLDIGPLGTDFSLKSGEKITLKVNLGGASGPAGGAGSGAAAAPAAAAAAPAGGLKLRAPPAAAGAPAAAPAPAASAGAGSSDWVTF